MFFYLVVFGLFAITHIFSSRIHWEHQKLGDKNASSNKKGESIIT
jgi:hypothetical protein